MSEENQVLRAVTSAYQWQVNCELTPSNCKALLDHVEELENIIERDSAAALFWYAKYRDNLGESSGSDIERGAIEWMQVRIDELETELNLLKQERDFDVYKAQQPEEERNDY
jgi:hypothetical protein